MYPSSTILDHHGDPIIESAGPNAASNGNGAVRFAYDVGDGVETKSFGGLAEYLRALHQAGSPSHVRAKDPFRNHVWVFAAAFAIATSAGQAPFRVFRETDAEVDRRRSVALKRYGRADWRPPRGSSRQAFSKHLSGSSMSRARMKALEPDFDHPLMDVLSRPNPYMSGSDLFLMTNLWMAVRGEVFWLKTDEEGRAFGRADGVPPRLWPLSPDCFEPILESGSYGPLIGWWLTPPPYLATSSSGIRIPVSTDEVVQFKYPNPADPLRGMSRITAAALTVRADLAGRTYNQKVLENGGRLGGILTHPGAVDPKEEKALAQKLKEQHGGERNAGKTKVLTGGWVWHPVSMSMVDLQILESQKWNRTEILAAMGVPDSVLGVSEAQTYATQLGQDRNFLEKTVIPLMKMEEAAIDTGLFFMDSDDVMGAHDLRDVEALRAGIDEKIAMAERLCGDKLHVPPRIAFEAVGMEVEEYEGDDVALVSFGQSTLGEAIAPVEPEPAPEPEDDPEDDPDEEDEDAEDLPEADTVEEALRIANYPAVTILAAKRGAPWQLTPSVRRAIGRHYRQKAARNRRWKDFVALESKSEGSMRRAYRSWVDQERDATLERFDAATAGKRAARGTLKADLDIAAVLPDIRTSANGLRGFTRPIYSGTLESIYNFTVRGDLAGIAVFEIDDPRFLDFFEKRQRVFTGRVTNTVFENLKKSLDTALQGAETIQQMRNRIGEVYDISAGSAKTLTVARTETAGFMNGARNVMFEAGGFPGKDWVDAGDEVTRVAHAIFGQAGPKRRDFDYMTIAPDPKPGRLLYPNDPEGSADQVINCRCLELPATEEEIT